MRQQLPGRQEMPLPSSGHSPAADQVNAAESKLAPASTTEPVLRQNVLSHVSFTAIGKQQFDDVVCAEGCIDLQEMQSLPAEVVTHCSAWEEAAGECASPQV